MRNTTIFSEFKVSKAHSGSETVGQGGAAQDQKVLLGRIRSKWNPVKLRVWRGGVGWGISKEEKKDHGRSRGKSIGGNSGMSMSHQVWSLFPGPLALERMGGGGCFYLSILKTQHLAHNRHMTGNKCLMD